MRPASTRPTRNEFSAARAPGKIILTGEHFVVLGAPAIAMAINLYSYATVKPAHPGRVEVAASIPLNILGQGDTHPKVSPHHVLEHLRLAARETLDYVGSEKSGVSLDVESEIPVGAGLGSSASTTVAIINAVANANHATLSRKEVFKIAFAPESYLHGSPSGVDHATSIYGGIIRFTKPDHITRLRPNHPPKILVCDTGVHRPTKRLVGGVVKKSKSKRKTFEAHIDEVRDISNSTIRALRHGDAEELGSLMNHNHDLLKQIGVSHPELNKLVDVARAKGALGAKLTGAGGGGCIIALCKDNKDEISIARALRRQGGIPYIVTMDQEGARITHHLT